MIISYKTQTLSFAEDVKELLCKIDTKLAKISENKLNASRYGAKIIVDLDVFYILNKYRKILYDKVNNSQCLKEYLVDDIISNIKQYLTSGKIQKFKKITPLDKPSSLPTPGDPAIINVAVNYNYGDYITYSSTSNRFVTEVVNDSWDQTDW
jgi:hypothetical protein